MGQLYHFPFNYLVFGFNKLVPTSTQGYFLKNNRFILISLEDMNFSVLLF